ncbi:MAG: sigma-70 family RNA polymerase sigma factor [Chloroflexota bacterium]
MQAWVRWVEKAQTGESGAFGQLVDHFQQMAYWTAVRYVDDPAQAHDVAQEAFIEAYHCLPSLREPQAFPAWFKRIIFKQSDRFLRRKRPLSSLEDELALPTWQLGPEAVVVQWQQQQQLQHLIQTLSLKQQEVVTRFYFDGLSLLEIAERLSLPYSTVKKRLYAARQKLKEKIPMTIQHLNPANDDLFAARVKFQLALQNDDLLQVRQLVRQRPELLSVKREWGVEPTGWYGPLGTTPLHWAASVGNLPLTALLVELGTAVNILDADGGTPLRRAAHMGETAVVRWLLDHGADPDMAGDNGQTPLHAAVIRNRQEVIKALLAYGADATLVDAKGQSAQEWAELKGLVKLAGLLGVEMVGGETAVSSTKTASVWETGIKLIDLFAPLKWGGRNGMFTPLAGIGFDVMMGELIQVMAVREGGHTIQIGAAAGLFNAETRQQQWSNYGIDDYVDLFFCAKTDPHRRKQQTVSRGLKRARKLAETKPVLLAVYTSIALAPGVMVLLDGVDDDPNITLFLIGPETIGAEPQELAKLDSAITFSLSRGSQGLWPAIDPIWSYSTAYRDADHASLSNQARRLCRRYEDLHPIFVKQGMAGFELPVYDGGEKTAVLRARRLHRFLCQPLTVVEPWTAIVGTAVSLDETLQTTAAILAGEFDHVPENELMMIDNCSPSRT